VIDDSAVRESQLPISHAIDSSTGAEHKLNFTRPNSNLCQRRTDELTEVETSRGIIHGYFSCMRHFSARSSDNLTGY
jgi:hypothetical protein